MKKHIKCLFFIFLLCMICTETVSAKEQKESSLENYTITETADSAYTTANLNVRSGPGTDFEIITTVKNGTMVDITGQCEETGWYRIIYGDIEGFACDSYLAKIDTEFKDSYDSNDLVQTIGTVSNDVVNRANELLSLVPQSLLDGFVQSGWNIYVSEYDVGNTYADGQYGRLLGLTKYNPRIIYLDNREAAAEEALHEFGHFVDWYNDWPCFSSEFTPIYNNRAIFNDYFGFSNGVYDEHELFAEAFAQYILRPDELKEICPDLFDFMDQLIPDN